MNAYVYLSLCKDALASCKAALDKLNQLSRELSIPDCNHTWSKARMFTQDAIDELEKIVQNSNNYQK